MRRAESVVSEIQRLHAAGLSVPAIAEAVGLSDFQIRDAIVNGRLDLHTTELLMRQPDRAEVSDRCFFPSLSARSNARCPVVRCKTPMFLKKVSINIMEWCCGGVMVLCGLLVSSLCLCK